jgi:hypothetical protein
MDSSVVTISKIKDFVSQVILSIIFLIKVAVKIARLKKIA